MNADSGVPYRNIREALTHSVWTPEEVDRERAVWPDLATTPRWRHDPDVGLVERSYLVPSAGWAPSDGSPRPVGLSPGIDGSALTVTIAENGARRRLWDEATAPRLNTYGDSYTHGDQVNDGETWQEYLAAHFLEPIGNFGLGGGSVYQTYLRMVKEEATSHGGDHLLFYMWGDDHLRSVLGWVSLLVGRSGMRLAIGNPTLRWDAASGRIVELSPWLRTADDLDRLSDTDWLSNEFATDVALQLCLYGGHPAIPETPQQIATVDDDLIGAVADSLGLPWSGTREEARRILDRISLEASIHVIEKARRFAVEHGKKIMFLLLDPLRSVKQLLDHGTRYDEVIADHLESMGAEFFDMTRIHADEIRATGGDYREFLARFFVDGHSHYNPAGNHHFAFKLKPRLVDWLDPKPLPYRDATGTVTDDYIFNGRFGAPAGEERD